MTHQPSTHWDSELRFKLQFVPVHFKKFPARVRAGTVFRYQGCLPM